ncbi:MAG: MATE family efflux transporter [Clostridiales bacterium]|nr:MATE family efflux transporter [Clostridiales bacterium]
MNNQSCLKEFARYSSLSVLGMLGVSCYILADTFFISKGLGTNGLASLNLAIPVYNFIHGCGLMLGMGGATKFSIFKSQRDFKNMNIVFSNTVYLSAIFAFVFVMIGLFFSKTLTALLGADIEIFTMTNTYLKWLLIFAPAFILNNVLLCFVRNEGNPRLSMLAMIIGSMSNILLDYIFIFSLNMGIFGAVFATGLSPVISIAVMLPYSCNKKSDINLVKTKMYSDIVKSNFAIGFPSFVAQLSTGIVIITFNTVILKLRGNTGVAAYGVVANIALVVEAIYTGISQGTQPLISSYYGINNTKNIRNVLRYAMITMLVISCVIYLSMFIFAEQITEIFNSESNPQLQYMATVGIKLYFTSTVFTGFNVIIVIFFTSIEKVIPAHIISLLRGLILIVPMTILLSVLWGMTGVWLTYPVTELLVAVIGMVLYRRYRKELYYRK